MKRDTKEDYLQSVYKVVYYIEKNYADKLTVESLSKIAGYSKYHFHRIFKSIMGESVGEYIRRVRLSDSSNKLKRNKNISEVALESGYKTYASFSKAFKERFNISPKDFSKQINQKKCEIIIEPEIVYFEETKVLCLRKEGDYVMVSKKAFSVLISFVEKEIGHHDEMMMYGIIYDDSTIVPKNKLRYDACVTYDEKSISPRGEVVAKVIEGGEHLYYLHKGTYHGLKEIYNMMLQYIIENEMIMADRPVFEKYLNCHDIPMESEKLKTEIYIPLVS